MPHQVTMPMLGLTMEEGTITEWLKQPGDFVTKEEPLFVVETDKSAVEVGAPASGVLSQIIVQVGQSASVSAPIAIIAQPGESVEPVPSAAPAAAPAPASAPVTGAAAQTAPASAETSAAAASATAPRVDGERQAVSPRAPPRTP
jgi:pyruvate/2-oxoglutarate dehydrogenase complex dihydrolipoamide acyltransferase (E2) component